MNGLGTTSSDVDVCLVTAWQAPEPMYQGGKGVPVAPIRILAERFKRRACFTNLARSHLSHAHKKQTACCAFTQSPKPKCPSVNSTILNCESFCIEISFAFSRFPSISRLNCDINVNNTMALRNTRLVRTYVDLDPRVRPLIMLIKYWAKRRALNDGASDVIERL